MRLLFRFTVFVCLLIGYKSGNVVAEGTWTNYPFFYFNITDIAFEGPYVWCATYGGGVVRYDTTDDSCVSYSEADGLGSNQVYSIAIDNAGVKWFGNSDGLSRFDGQTWITYEENKWRDLYGPPAVVTVAIDSDNTKWYSILNYILSFDGETKTEHQIDVSGQLFDIAIDNDIKWLGCYNGISKLEGEKVTPYTTPFSRIKSIAIDSNHNVWIGATGGVSRFDEETWTTYTEEDGLASNYVYDIAIDRSNVLWIATGGGVSRFDGKSWTTYTTKNGLASTDIRSIAIDSNNNIWIGTNKGHLMRYDGTFWSSHTLKSESIGNIVRVIATGNDGSKWFGTSISGAFRFDGESLTPCSETDTGVFSIATDSKSVLWFAGYSGLCSFDGKTWKNYDFQDTFNSIAIDSNDVKWLTSRSRIVRLEGETWTVIRWHNGTFYCIAVDIDDKVWIGSNEELFLFDGETLTSYRTEDGLAGNRVLSIAIDSDGVKWFACSHYVYPEYDPAFGYFKDVGVSRYDGETWTTYTTKDGLASNKVNDIAIDNDGVVWFATDRGVSRYDGETWTTYRTGHGLGHNIVFSVDIDIDGSLWFGTKKGVYHFNEETGTFITEELEKKPSPFTVSPPYPNPFNPLTTINYSIRQPGKVCLSIYDVLGRKVDTLTDREHRPGNYSVTWNAGGFSSGLYFYRIEVDGEKSGMGKMMLMK